MRKTFFMITMSALIMLSGCDRCKNPTVIDTGELSPETLAMVPYSDGQVVKLKHSGGLVIDYKVSRATTTETRDYSAYCEILKFRVDATILEPDYPAFPIAFYIANTDENYLAFEAMVGKYYFNMPKSLDDALYAGSSMSLSDVELNDTLYKDVFMMKTPSQSIRPNEMVYVDSLWYNYSSGVIKIIMSNMETFTVYE